MAAFVSTSFASAFSRNALSISSHRPRLSKSRNSLTACANRSLLDADIPQEDPNSPFTPPTSNQVQFETSQPESGQAIEPSQPDSDPSSSSWYTIAEEIGKTDTGDAPKPSNASAPLDLTALDVLGRNLLSNTSYNSVVDIDIEKGGMLADDIDNNDLFCGVGLEALIESEQILKNLEADNIETATHVQLAAIPRVLDGRDIVIQSHTGTGKTLAFLLPLLDDIDTSLDNVQGIIVAPTRELAMQISRECDRLIVDTDIRSLALIGGANPARQVDKLRKRAPHIVVGTPGRLAELEHHRELRVFRANMIVIDEVDQCLTDAFLEDVVYLLRAVPRKTQKVLVSATGDVDSVREFAGGNLHKGVLLRVGGAQRLPKNIEHYYCVVPSRLRIDLLRKLMYTKPVPTRAMVFVDDPRRVDLVVERLYKVNIQAAALRGNAHKLERAEVLAAFRKGQVGLLVTTEVAARGLDIPDVSHVFNLDLPTDADHYVHRAGRCGRVGAEGIVISIATSETAFVMGRLEKELGVDIKRMEPHGGVYGEPIDRPKKAGRVQKEDGEGSGRGKDVVQGGSVPVRHGERERRRDGRKNTDTKSMRHTERERKGSAGSVRHGDKVSGKVDGFVEAEIGKKSGVESTTDSGKVTGGKKKKRSGRKKAVEVKVIKKKKTNGDMSRSRDLNLRAATRGWVGNRDGASGGSD